MKAGDRYKLTLPEGEVEACVEQISCSYNLKVVKGLDTLYVFPAWLSNAQLEHYLTKLVFSKKIEKIAPGTIMEVVTKNITVPVMLVYQEEYFLISLKSGLRYGGGFVPREVLEVSNLENWINQHRISKGLAADAKIHVIGNLREYIKNER